MAATPERIFHVLEQYKERLHQRGDEGHDEELDYIKQILASPIFYDYVQNSSQLSQEETSIFSEVTNDLLSGFQETTDGKMSPAEKHKQRVQRKRSLKALRNVVNSPRIKPRRPHGAGGANSSDGGKASSSMYDHGTPPLATSPPDRGPGPLSSSTSGSRFDNSPSTITSGSIATVVNGKRVQDFTPLTGRNVVDQDYTPVMGLSNGVLDFDTPSSGPLTFESPSRNLSNSTGTLIERSTSPSSDDTLLRRSDENLLANGGTPSSDGNLLHRLKTEGGATTSAYAIGNGTGPNSIPSLGGMDWDLSPTKQPQQQQLLPSSSIHDPGPPPTQGALKLKLPPMNVAHRQPPSYQLHMQQQQNHTTTTAPHHQIVTSPQVENKRPPPPPYGQAGGNLMPQRRAKSFDRLLDSSPSDGAISIHLPPLNHQAPDTTTNIADLAPFAQKQQQPQVISGGGGLTPSSNYGNPIVRPMTDGMVTTNYLTAAERRRTILTVRLEKGEKGLGFRVNGLKSKQYGGGLFVQDLQPGGIAERDGQLRVDDQITHINGHALKEISHNEGVKLLQSARGMIELVVMRDSTHSHAPPITSTSSSLHHRKMSPDPPTAASTITNGYGNVTAPHALSYQDQNDNVEETGGDSLGVESDDDSAHQRRILTIELPNEGHGFGFGVISTDDDRTTIVHSILAGGIAERDGRLQKGDQLLQINEESVIHMRNEDVIAKLRNVSGGGYPIKLVIARLIREEENPEDVHISDVHSSDDEIEEFEVEILKRTGGSLGITIAGLVKTDTGEEVMGIYVTSMNPAGAAADDGRIKVGDRILKVDGHSLRGLENMEAASVLRNCGNPVRLVMCRKRSISQENGEAEHGEDSLTSPTLHRSSAVGGRAHGEIESNTGQQEEREGAEGGEGVGNGLEEEERTIVEDLVKEWSNRLGPKYQVKVDQVTKSDEGGLGIRLESTAELDEQGQPHMDSLHNVICYINPSGPVGRHNILREGDEIIMVNGHVLVGLPHDEATQVILNTPKFVTIVVCRTVPDGLGEGLEAGRTDELDAATGGGIHVVYTSESEEDRHPLLTPSSSDTLQALPAIDFSNFARRFERQSWRERHEEERRRLKQRFEQRREEHERHIRQQEEELLQKEMEIKERQRRQTEEEEERKRADAEQQHQQQQQNRLSANLQYDYNTNYPGYEYERQVHSPDSMQGSDSSSGVLSPVPGSKLWEPDVTMIDLLKGEDGLGFSILDFADPHSPGDRVILIHSLVPGGLAMRDGRLKIGDKLLSVNRVSVVNHSLQFAVQQLVAVLPGGMVKIGICHPLPMSPDINSDPSSPLTESNHGSMMFDDDLEDEDVGEEEGEEEEGEEEERSVENVASVELDSEDKPVLDLAVPNEQGQDPETRPHGSGGEEEEEGEEVKKKKPSESDDDDDEPPPPYSKNDPVEDDKSDNEGGDPSSSSSAAATNSGSGQVGGASNEGELVREPERESESAAADHRRIQNPSSSFGFEVQLGDSSTAQQSHTRSSENVQSSENETDASRPSSQAQRSPASMSRISSPERGRTLSELTRITPEDESRLGQCGGGVVSTTNTLPLPTQDDQLEPTYSSDTTLVNSESQPSQTEISHESSVSSIITDASGTPRVQHQKKKEKKSRTLKIRRKNDKAKSSGSNVKLKKDAAGGSLEDKRKRHRLHSPLHKVPSPHNLSVNYNSLSQQAFTSSQDSNFDIGLSPEGESGEHSSEVDMEPREIRIRKEGSSSLGLSITYDDKTNAIVVKSVSSSGAVAKDGRIRVGDRIESINGKSMIGVNTNKARHILKKASKLDELAIVYVPAIQTYIPAAGYSGKRQPSSEMSLNDSQGSLLSTESGGERQQQQPSASYRQQQLTMTSQMPQGDAPSLMTSQSGGMTHHPPPPPQGVQAMHMGPQISSAAGMSRLVQPTPQWPGYHHGNMGPPPPRTMTRGYYDDQMGKPPPPPYGYPHQSTTTPPQGIISNQPGAYPSLPTWNMHSSGPQPPPSGIHMAGMGVGMMQAPPSMIPWSMAPQPPPPHPSMMPPHREPPQYADFHAMAASQQMASAGVQQNQIHPPQYQNFNSTTSGAHMTSMHSSGGGGGGAMTGSGSGLPNQQQQQQQPPPPPASQLPPRPMNKSQSESKFQNSSQQGGGQQPRSGHERRHNSQGTSDGGQPQFPVGYRQNRPIEVRRHSSKQKYSSSSQTRRQMIEDEFPHESGQKPWLSQEAGVVHRSSSGGDGFANRKARSQPNISQGGSGGGGGGAPPERERPRHTKYPRTATLQESPDHSHHNSWAINDEEDPALRGEFPEVDGHLFEVWLKKGKTGGLGLSIVANTTSQALRGIVIMGIQKGGAAEENGEIKWGDMILKVNDTVVIGMSQTQVQELLANASPNVRFVLLRQYGNSATTGGGGGANNGRGGAKQQQHTTTGSGISLEGLPQVQAVILYCKDKRKGFGFQIEKHEEASGTYTIVVSNITRGGVADTSGQLKVGDQILSVDGTKTLGYAVEKARNLIQQGKSRGQVNIVVATRGHVPSLSSSSVGVGEWGGGEKGGTGSAGGPVTSTMTAVDSRNKIKDIPDGVVLRKKKKSSLKLSSSRRRPVSVDYDLNSNSLENELGDPVTMDNDDFQMGGASTGGGRVLKDTTNNRSSHYSNRNSHPLTEREMEQGLQSIEGQKDIIPFKECEIIIFKGHQVLGLIITGGTDSLLDGVYIQKIIPGSPADKDGRLKPGDKILRINNSSMEGVPRDEALRALQQSSSFVHITIVRDPNSAPTMPPYKEEESPSPIGSGGDIETVELMKPEQGGLGLLIFETDDQPGVFIQEVVQNKAAYLDGRIRPGDRILAINGEKIYNAGQNYVVRLLQTCRGRVTLTVCHPPSTFSSPAREFQRTSDLDGAHPAFPPPEYPFDREPLPPYTSSSGAPQSNSRIPFHREGGGSGFVGSYHQFRGGSYGTDPDIDMPVPSQEDMDNRIVKVISLHRGPLGLGISIVGGKGSIHGDLPIYIKQVFNEGAAGQDGRLKKGDQLLSVNGISFENVTHKFAAETLKYLQGDVTLEAISND